MAQVKSTTSRVAISIVLSLYACGGPSNPDTIAKEHFRKLGVKTDAIVCADSGSWLSTHRSCTIRMGDFVSEWFCNYERCEPAHYESQQTTVITVPIYQDK